jgi:hypothetical protein
MTISEKETRPPSVVKSLVKKILESPTDHEWTLQGLGMLRLYLDDERRLHVWDSRYAVENVSQMHTHPWNFKSHVVAGELHNTRFVVVDSEPAPTTAKEFNKQTIFCGVGGGLVDSPRKVHLDVYSQEFYSERESYDELAHEIHISQPVDGTVTIVKREFLEDADHALVFWETGEWVSAEPRPATEKEILDITSYSLNRWF